MGFVSEWRQRRYAGMVQRNIARAGCHVTKVVDPSQQQVTFAYSTGFLDTVGQGELIIFGMPADVAHHIINDVLDKCRNTGLQIADGMRLPVLQGAEMIARRVMPEYLTPEFFRDTLAHRHSENRELTAAFQLVWPAPETLVFPWDDGFPQDLRHFQPALYEPRLNS